MPAPATAATRNDDLEANVTQNAVNNSSITAPSKTAPGIKPSSSSSCCSGCSQVAREWLGAIFGVTLPYGRSSFYMFFQVWA